MTLRRVLAVFGVLVLGVVVLVVHDLSDWTAASVGPAGGAAASLEQRLARVADRKTLRLGHTGRRTGKAHEVTVWFAVDGATVYLTTMDRGRQSVRNVVQTPRVQLSIGPERFEGTVTPVTADADKRHEYALLVQKYWIIRIMDGVLRLMGRDPAGSAGTGKGGFFRVQLAGD